MLAYKLFCVLLFAKNESVSEAFYEESMYNSVLVAIDEANQKILFFIVKNAR